MMWDSGFKGIPPYGRDMRFLQILCGIHGRVAVKFNHRKVTAMLLTILVYLLESYAIYRLAVVRGLPMPLLAFIPFFQLYMLGQIGDSLKYLNRTVNDLLGQIPLAYALPLLSIAGSLLRYPLTLFISMVTALALLVVYYLVFSFYEPKLCILFTAVCSLNFVFTVLLILSRVPVLGGVAGALGVVVLRLLQFTPFIGPLLILYCLRGYRRRG